MTVHPAPPALPPPERIDELTAVLAHHNGIGFWVGRSLQASPPGPSTVMSMVELRVILTAAKRLATLLPAVQRVVDEATPPDGSLGTSSTDSIDELRAAFLSPTPATRNRGAAMSISDGIKMYPLAVAAAKAAGLDAPTEAASASGDRIAERWPTTDEKADRASGETAGNPHRVLCAVAITQADQGRQECRWHADGARWIRGIWPVETGWSQISNASPRELMLAERLAAAIREKAATVEAAYRESWRSSSEGRTYRKASEDAGWLNSRARAALEGAK